MIEASCLFSPLLLLISSAISNNLMMKCLDPRVTLLSKNLFRANSYAMHSTTPVERNPSSTLRDRVHILGLGSIGTFVAHSVSEIPNGPSVILLLHRRSLLDHYRQNRNQIFLSHGMESIKAPPAMDLR